MRHYIHGNIHTKTEHLYETKMSTRIFFIIIIYATFPPLSFSCKRIWLHALLQANNRGKTPMHNSRKTRFYLTEVNFKTSYYYYYHRYILQKCLPAWLPQKKKSIKNGCLVLVPPPLFFSFFSLWFLSNSNFSFYYNLFYKNTNNILFFSQEEKEGEREQERKEK